MSLALASNTFQSLDVTSHTSCNSCCGSVNQTFHQSNHLKLPSKLRNSTVTSVQISLRNSQNMTKNQKSGLKSSLEHTESQKNHTLSTSDMNDFWDLKSFSTQNFPTLISPHPSPISSITLFKNVQSILEEDCTRTLFCPGGLPCSRTLVVVSNGM